ncbi:hypothetical protein X740_28535 [Mesorhizobium sp. LNHC221B00]|nr:hypothetical protein X740_28535 [Mesorhizobium sp. LNHC221B00]
MALLAGFDMLFMRTAAGAGPIALLPLIAASCLLLLATFVFHVLVALLARLHMLLVTTTLVRHSSSPYCSTRRQVPRESKEIEG